MCTHAATPAGNLAARMGRWSASHWKTATFGWLALRPRRLRASAAWSARRTSTRTRRGRASPAAWTGSSTPGSSSPPARASSIQSRLAPDERSRLRGGDHGRRRAASRSWTTSRTCGRRSIPATPARSRRTGTRRSSSSRSAATPTRPSTRSARSSTRVDERRRQAHPRLFVGEFGDASAVEGGRDRLRRRPRRRPGCSRCRSR